MKKSKGVSTKCTWLSVLSSLTLISANAVSETFTLDDVKPVPFTPVEDNHLIQSIGIGSCFAPQLGDEIWKAVAY